jgi:hypothetical protein
MPPCVVSSLTCASPLPCSRGLGGRDRDPGHRGEGGSNGEREHRRRIGKGKGRRSKRIPRSSEGEEGSEEGWVGLGRVGLVRKDALSHLKPGGGLGRVGGGEGGYFEDAGSVGSQNRGRWRVGDHGRNSVGVFGEL